MAKEPTLIRDAEIAAAADALIARYGMNISAAEAQAIVRHGIDQTPEQTHLGPVSTTGVYARHRRLVAQYKAQRSQSLGQPNQPASP